MSDGPPAEKRRRAAGRGEYRLTRGGVYFAFATLAVGFAASNTGNNLAFIFFSMMISLIVMSAVISTLSIRGLSVDRVAPRQAQAGERFPITLILINRKRLLSSYSLRAVDRFDDGQDVGACYSLQVPAEGRVESSYIIQIPRRGLLRLSSVRVVSTYPFGFYRRSVNLTCESEIMIGPYVLPVEEWRTYSPVALGESGTLRRGMGSDFYGPRDYHPGESARLIHWKLSARRGRLVARDFEEEEKKRVTLLLDNGHSTPKAPEVVAAFEKAVVACASLASAYLERDYETQLITRSGRVPMSVGFNQRQRVLRSLGLIGMVQYTGAPLWMPPPAGDEAHVFIDYTSSSGRLPPSNVELLSIQDTPPFADYELPPGALNE